MIRYMGGGRRGIEEASAGVKPSRCLGLRPQHFRGFMKAPAFPKGYKLKGAYPSLQGHVLFIPCLGYFDQGRSPVQGSCDLLSPANIAI